MHFASLSSCFVEKSDENYVVCQKFLLIMRNREQESKVTTSTMGFDILIVLSSVFFGNRR